MRIWRICASEMNPLSVYSILSVKSRLHPDNYQKNPESPTNHPISYSDNLINLINKITNQRFPFSLHHSFTLPRGLPGGCLGVGWGLGGGWGGGGAPGPPPPPPPGPPRPPRAAPPPPRLHRRKRRHTVDAPMPRRLARKCHRGDSGGQLVLASDASAWSLHPGKRRRQLTDASATIVHKASARA